VIDIEFQWINVAPADPADTVVNLQQHEAIYILDEIG